eukprot:scaffold492_cov257-Pinguiococcus_pyrenoidosus.AAC.20
MQRGSPDGSHLGGVGPPDRCAALSWGQQCGKLQLATEDTISGKARGNGAQRSAAQRTFLPQALEEGWEQHLQHFISIDELRGLPRISHGCVQQLVQRNDSQQRIPAIEPDGLHGSLHGRVRGHWDVRLFQLSLRLHSAVPVMSAEIEGVQGAEAAQLVDPCAVWIEHTLANRFVPCVETVALLSLAVALVRHSFIALPYLSRKASRSLAFIGLQGGLESQRGHLQLLTSPSALAAGVLISRHEALNGISCQRDVRDELRRLQLPGRRDDMSLSGTSL